MPVDEHALTVGVRGSSDRADTGADPDGRADLAEHRLPVDTLADKQDLVRLETRRQP
nr:hypothetical protein [Streptomyces sp. TLI_235]